MRNLPTGLQTMLGSAMLLAALGRPTVAQPIVQDLPTPIPAPRTEVITVEPSPEHVWISGYWERKPDDWQWIEGHWEKPPFAPARWVQGYWKYQQGKYAWHEGHWASSATGVVVEKPVTIPALPAETVPVAPAANLTWIPGRWEWNGQWVWYQGYYAAAPAPSARWVPGYWKEGLFGKWRWTEGHWES